MKLHHPTKLKRLGMTFALISAMTTACITPGEEQTVIDILTGESDTDSATETEQEFGDAPDGLSARYDNGVTATFPSRLIRQGAHHADTLKVALGLPDEAGNWPSTIEADATDPYDSDGVPNIVSATIDPDGEADRDEKDDGLLTFVFGDDEYQTLEFSVTAAADAVADTYYLNVLFDWNKDGKWQGSDSNGAEEWAVKNHQIAISPGNTFVDATEAFLTGVKAHPAWVRLTLSERAIDPNLYPEGWDGTGAFTLGETEDYLLTDTQVLILEDDGVGIPGVPHSPYNPPIGGGGGGGGGDDPCEYTNYLSMTLCKGRSVTKLLTIGGFAPDSITAASSDPGVAGVSLNEANVTITGNEAGTTTVTVIATQGGCTYYVIVTVTVKDCPPARQAMIDCCTPEQIRRNPAVCRNCHVVGRQHNQSNTYGGGGTIPETDMEGVKTNISKSFVIVRGGGLVDVVTVYYECDACPTPQAGIDGGCVDVDDDETETEPETEADVFTASDEDFFDLLEHMLWGGANQLIDTWEEYEEMRACYDLSHDEATYECADRYFQELYDEMEMAGQ